MNFIQNLSIATPTPCNKSVASCAALVAITAIAIAILGLASSPQGPFNAIVNLGTTNNGIILGASTFVLILDLIWIATLCKKQNTIESAAKVKIPESERAQLISQATIIDPDHAAPSLEEVMKKSNIASPYTHIFILPKYTGSANPAFSDEGLFYSESEKIFPDPSQSKKLLLIWAKDRKAKELQYNNIFEGEKRKYPNIYKNMEIRVYYGNVTTWWSSTTLNSELAEIIAGKTYR